MSWRSNRSRPRTRRRRAERCADWRRCTGRTARRPRPARAPDGRATPPTRAAEEPATKPPALRDAAAAAPAPGAAGATPWSPATESSAWRCDPAALNHTEGTEVTEELTAVLRYLRSLRV